MSVTYDGIVNAQKIQGDIIRKTSLTFSDTFSHLTAVSYTHLTLPTILRV